MKEMSDRCAKHINIRHRVTLVLCVFVLQSNWNHWNDCYKHWISFVAFAVVLAVIARFPVTQTSRQIYIHEEIERPIYLIDILNDIFCRLNVEKE